jgi:hypothetical protein
LKREKKFFIQETAADSQEPEERQPRRVFQCRSYIEPQENKPKPLRANEKKTYKDTLYTLKKNTDRRVRAETHAQSSRLRQLLVENRFTLIANQRQKTTRKDENPAKAVAAVTKEKTYRWRKGEEGYDGDGESGDGGGVAAAAATVPWRHRETK